MSELSSQSSAGVDRAQELLALLELEQVERNLFLGQNESLRPHRLFGGQVLAQALKASCSTVNENDETLMSAHGMHGYFMRAGKSEQPVLYEVERIRDGRSFATRRVVAVQDGAAIFSLDVSFQKSEEGLEHGDPLPNVPPPEELHDDVAAAEALPEDDPQRALLGLMALRQRPFETRSVFVVGSEAWSQNRFWSPVWMRFRCPVDAQDPVLSRCLLAYASDVSLVSTAALPHQASTPRSGIQMASLDHALWIHRDFDPNQWLLFHKHTTRSSGSRGLCHASFFSREGDLIASVSQEGLLRRARS